MNKLTTATAIGLSAAVLSGCAGEQIPSGKEQQQIDKAARSTAAYFTAQILAEKRKSKAKRVLRIDPLSTTKNLDGKGTNRLIAYSDTVTPQDKSTFCSDWDRGTIVTKYEQANPANVYSLSFTVTRSTYGNRCKTLSYQDKTTTLNRSSDGHWHITEVYDDGVFEKPDLITDPDDADFAIDDARADFRKIFTPSSEVTTYTNSVIPG